MCHVGQLLHGFREVQKAPLGLLRLALPLGGLVTVQHHFLQLLKACNGCKVTVCDGELDALQAQNLQVRELCMDSHQSSTEHRGSCGCLCMAGCSQLICRYTLIGSVLLERRQRKRWHDTQTAALTGLMNKRQCMTGAVGKASGRSGHAINSCLGGALQKKALCTCLRKQRPQHGQASRYAFTTWHADIVRDCCITGGQDFLSGQMAASLSFSTDASSAVSHYQSSYQ